MRLADLMNRECALLAFSARDKWEAIERMLDHLVEHGKVSRDQRPLFLVALKKREALASTGMDHGVALPHAQVEGLDEGVMAVAISEEGIPFDSSDGGPARILVLLVIPKQRVRVYVRTLAGIARLLNCPDMRRRLLDARSAEELVRVIHEEEAKSLDPGPPPPS